MITTRFCNPDLGWAESSPGPPLLTTTTGNGKAALSAQTWRLIPLLQAPGSVQMALDQWLLEQHRLGLHPPTLRFYTWFPPAISLGYHQRAWPRFWQELVWDDTPVELVRRPTGGRAVLHQGDLTYMVVTSGLPGTRMASYRYLCEFLIRGWRSLGLTLHSGRVRQEYANNPNCFGIATGADLVLPNGAKFIGSAQLRRGKAILQHGSMRLNPDLELLSRVFPTAGPLQSPFCPIQLEQPSFDRITEALVAAARDCFGVRFVNQPLSESEWQTILAQPRLSLHA